MTHCDPAVDFSVIIPVFNEQDALPRLFAALESQVGLSLEIIFSDGGSSDRSMALIDTYRSCSHHQVVLVQGEQGRSCQLNRGGRLARGTWLLFLHADSVWSQTDLFIRALRSLEDECLKGQGFVAGHFSLKFSGEELQPRFYRYLSEKAALNLPGTIFGDQGLMLHRTAWHDLNGYDETLPVLEDVELVERISRSGRIICLPGTLVTSSRRYEEEGRHCRQFLNAVLLLIFASDQRSLLPVAMGSYRSDRGIVRTLIGLFQRLGQLPLSAWWSFWYGCGSAMVRYLWVVPFRLYWWRGSSSRLGQKLVRRWNVTILTKLDCRLWHSAAALTLIIVFYLTVLLSLPWCADSVFRHRLLSAKGEIDEFDI
ncbi:glycosyltransferase [uncultured Desulfuromonas sp.]|uniref:glycosyltransferase n=1 Tax=uncultured Desulfuromonas sp. TaxID=181013 RepID=UPI002AAC0AE5|nr:glycosyltransferase [uncultured Desulfuromonas sp.]